MYRLSVLILLILSSALIAQNNEALLIAEQFRGQKIPKALMNEISVNLDDAPFEVALAVISEKGNIKLNYSRDELPLNEIVSIHMENAYVLEVLLTVLKKTNTELRFTKGGVMAITPANQDHAGKSKVFGSVTDAVTGNALPGANISIKGTNLGAASNLDGTFFLFIPPGSYTLLVQYIGYEKKDVPINVEFNKDCKVDVQLNLTVVAGEEVVVTAQAEGQLAAINQQLTSRTISNVVAADRIQELPDANATESVGRLPGVSIIRNGGEGSEVVIRGMSSENNLVTINGVRMPSTEFNNRGHTMSIISSNILEGIELTKAVTPDKDADVVGGTVDFKLKEAPEGFQKQFLLQGGYNSHANSYDMLRANGGISNRFFNGKVGIQALVSFERANRSSHQLTGNYIQEDRLPKEGENYVSAETQNISLDDRNEIRKRLGGTLIFDYNLHNHNLKWTNFLSTENRDRLDRTTVYNVDGGNVDRRIMDPDRQLKSYQSSVAGEHNLYWGSIDWGLSIALSEREHPFARRWVFSQSSAFDPIVSLKYLETAPTEIIQNYLETNILETRLMSGRSIKEFQEQKDQTAFINLEVPVQITDNITSKFKIGGKFRSQQRFYNQTLGDMNFVNGFGVEEIKNYAFNTFGEDWIRTQSGQVSMMNFYDPNYDPGLILGDTYLMGPGLDVDKLDEVGKYFHDNNLYDYVDWNERDDYQNRENISAGYIMAEINLGQQVTLIPGVRYENENTRLTAKYAENRGYGGRLSSVRDTTATRNQGLWFPMIHLRYKPTNWFDVRLARTRTVSRPSYNLLAPKLSIDIDGKNVTLGYPELKPMLSTNYDLYFSFYTNEIGLITLGGFYKEVKDQFDNISFVSYDPEADEIDPLFKNYDVTKPYNNEFDGTVKGVELDVQTRFWYLPSPFNGIVLTGNFARIFSDTRYFFNKTTTVPTTTFPFSKTVRIDSSRTGRLQNQADYIANVAIGYDRGGFSARLSMNYQGNTLTRAHRTYEALDGFTEDRYQWDLMIKQKIMKGMNIYLNLNNFTNQPDRSFIRYQDRPTALSYYGMTGDIGIRYQF